MRRRAAIDGRRGPRPAPGAPPTERAGRIFAAIDRRGALLARRDTTVCRLVHGAADGIEGFVLERFGDVLVAQLHEGRLRGGIDELAAACESVRKRLGARAVYRKTFARDRSAALSGVSAAHADPAPWLGQRVEPEILVVENGMRFAIRPYDGYSVGLFLDNRDNRARVRARAAGRRVLNTFSYTGSFSVAAALGGAEQVVSVDVSAKAQAWARQNFVQNGLDVDRHEFIRADVLKFLRRAGRAPVRFDLVVLDPPTFARLKRVRRPFVLSEQLEALLDGAAQILAPGGELLLCTNQRDLPEAALRRALGRRFANVEPLGLPEDFAGDRSFSRSFWCSGGAGAGVGS